VAVVIAVLVAIVLVVVLVVALAVYVRRAPDPSPEVLVRLYEIRKRMDVALFRLEARRDADRIRRELCQELQQHDQDR
jgi:hypothetical protein